MTRTNKEGYKAGLGQSGEWWVKDPTGLYLEFASFLITENKDNSGWWSVKVFIGDPAEGVTLDLEF